MIFHLPIKDNIKIAKLLKKMGKDAELIQMWKCANVNAVDRCGISDHGGVHIRIVANAALKVLRLLIKKGIKPSVVENYALTNGDAELIVVLASCLHDIGISVHRDSHEEYSIQLAYLKLRELLKDIYEEPEITIITSEILHAIVAHNAKETCLTIEAGVLKVADALDMAKGRSRIPFKAGQINIHSVSAQAVESVDIEEGEARPVRIVINLTSSAGIFQVDELLKKKLMNSSIKEFIEVVAKQNIVSEKPIFETFTI